MLSIKKYSDVKDMIGKCETYLPEEDRAGAILMLNELSALRNALEVSAAKTTLNHTKGRTIVNGEKIRMVAVYDEKETDDDTAMDALLDGNIKSDAFIAVKQDSVAGRFFLGENLKSANALDKPEKTE